MTPQEKAKGLVDSIYLIISNNGQYTGEHSIPFKFEEAKKCSLIAVDEISEHCYQVMKPFWLEVKQEIEKL